MWFHEETLALLQNILVNLRGKGNPIGYLWPHKALHMLEKRKGRDPGRCLSILWRPTVRKGRRKPQTRTIRVILTDLSASNSA